MSPIPSQIFAFFALMGDLDWYEVCL